VAPIGSVGAWGTCARRKGSRKTMAEVRLEHIAKQFGDVSVVKDINLTIRDEEFLVLVGPSGCGKTTILRMIAGLEEITSGDLFIGDRRVNDIPPKDRDIAMVFQNYALYPHMTVFDNMAFGLKLRGMSRDEIDSRVRAVAETLELTPYLKRRPRELSGGQRQRVALGRAIVREPKVFLMDEPLSNLDAKLRVETRANISRLHQRIRKTTIYVTHDQTEAMTMGDRIVVLNAGSIQQIGTPQDLYDHPANIFVATFIGTPAMNMFTHTRLTRQNGALVAQIGDQSLTLPDAVAGALAAYEGREVTLGLRPEDFTGQDEATPGRTLQGTVDVVEHLGNEQLLYVKIGELNVLARVEPSRRMRTGDTVTLAANGEHVHVFDPETARVVI
jgi:multiple sugar transport system ATP-binding protein